MTTTNHPYRIYIPIDDQTAVLKSSLPRYSTLTGVLHRFIANPDKKSETALKAAMKNYAISYMIDPPEVLSIERAEELDRANHG
jgi:hypothetical protein